jgi:hypothetical protein
MCCLETGRRLTRGEEIRTGGIGPAPEWGALVCVVGGAGRGTSRGELEDALRLE